VCNPDMVLMEASWTCIGRGGGCQSGYMKSVVVTIDQGGAS
jgi:hypothetical protein